MVQHFLSAITQLPTDGANEPVTPAGSAPADLVDLAAAAVGVPEFHLLGNDGGDGESDAVSANVGPLQTSPVFTGDALQAAGHEDAPQRAVYGRVLSQHADGFLPEVDSPKLFINTDEPFSALVCGVQVRFFLSLSPS